MSSKKLTLIAIVGLPGSGKTAAANFFKEKGFTVLRFGDQTDIGLKELGLPRTEENERQYREQIRKELGMAAMAIKIVPRIREAETHTDRIVLDGMKGLLEYEYIKKEFPDFKVLCLYAPPKLRYERLASRKVRPLTGAEAEARDMAELKALDTGGSMALADYLIKNEGSFEDLEFELKAYLVTSV